MIIDIHGHVSAPQRLYAYKSELLAARGSHGRGAVGSSNDDVRDALNAPQPPFGNKSHMELLDDAGIDVQIISPRPFHSMHSEEPARIVDWYTQATNDVIAQACEVFPDRFRGFAGLPQAPSTGPAAWAVELRRAVTELGFVGCLLNPDPYEGTQIPPALGDRYWYPLYEALCELDVPAMVHTAGCKPPAREDYSLHFVAEETIGVLSLLTSSVFTDFPELKIIVPHGGGAVPYQIGRWRSSFSRAPGPSFDERMNNLWFDTCLYTKESLELLIKTLGPERLMLGTEKPGTGTVARPDGEGWYDDVNAMITSIEWLADADRDAILGGNAQKLFGIR
ncbi:amidohydrolase family protein [Williamsia soli]|uniref:amidohydrolase family protein n=1 Tax=Williamsia soli TaxID=364929 RepID=UPI001A9F5293|nr:amidohydrolase family protein [Williamsia soli]